VPSRPPEAITVTTEEGFDAAFASVDRIVVEGDEQLLSYAVAKAMEPGDEARGKHPWTPILLAVIGLALAVMLVFLLWGAAPHKPGGALAFYGSRLLAASPSQSLAWLAVAIVAIVAVTLIARQAIAGGSNVEISWKVTEKVTGRVVITKVQTRRKIRGGPGRRGEPEV
jgi:hypothetical protein